MGPVAICVLGDFNPETGEVTERVRDVSVSGFTIRGFKDKDAIVIVVSPLATLLLWETVSQAMSLAGSSLT